MLYFILILIYLVIGNVVVRLIVDKIYLDDNMFIISFYSLFFPIILFFYIINKIVEYLLDLI